MSLNSPIEPILTDAERKIFASMPFFGGEGEAAAGGNTINEDEKKNQGTPAGNQQQPSGGNTNSDDPIAKLQSDPNAIKQLLDQVSKQSSDLANITQERDGLATEKEKQARAQMSKEEGLQKDLENAQVQIEQLHELVTTMAKQNAFLTASGDTKWNSVKQAMAELDDNNFTVDVNLEQRTADIQGIENEVKRIAKDFPWLVKSAAENNEQGNNGNNSGRGAGRPRTTGAPPAPPKGNEGKQERRAALMSRFPVLQQR